MCKDSEPPGLKMDPVFQWLLIRNEAGPADELRLCIVKHLWDAGINVAFSDRNGGAGKGPFTSLNVDYRVGDDASTVSTNRSLLGAALEMKQGQAFVTVGQPHRDMIVTADEAKLKEVDADAIFAEAGSTAVMLMFADCLPIVYVDVFSRTALSIHAGWRGAVAGIAETAVDFMKKRGSHPSNIEVFFGPSARGCCYEVGPQVLGMLGLPSESNRKVDLVSWHIENLTKSGIPRENIHDSGLCTCCRPDEYFSFRRDGAKTGRQASIVIIR